MGLLVICVGAAATPLEGSWSTRESGYFSLELVQNGKLVCGQVTAISGDKVDASWVIGVVGVQGASMEFTSGFAEKEARGTAAIQLNAGILKWRVVRGIDQSWIWGEASMARERWVRKRRLLVQNWCKQHWITIQQGRSDSIDLQP